MVLLPYSYAITPEQIIELKKAGVSDKTIQIMLEQEKEGTRVIKDEQGNVYIIYSTRRSMCKTKEDIKEEEKVKRAWKMLENIIIDKR
ncbi:MAG: hypothetical protein C4B57_02905 [Deltaproteobacteria bacterium]|nr:MAG: hypothetical protein C4B57_02905 [Deltaproteobacteria bacterium]